MEQLCRGKVQVCQLERKTACNKGHLQHMMMCLDFPIEANDLVEFKHIFVLSIIENCSRCYKLSQILNQTLNIAEL